MQKVITIDLNGNAFQLDEEAYDALRAYLTLAEVRLKDNPDRAEILKDFEQAIAEKCRRFLGPTKTVVTAAEMQQIVAEMGPVEPGGDSGARTDAETHEAASAGAGPRKRLYRIREGAQWAGVCNGIATYFGVDVAIVRVVFVVLTTASLGLGVFAYWIIASVIPEAQTADERAAAHGQPPFNAQDLIDQAKLSAQELIDQAKKSAADFKGSAEFTGAEWRRQWRQQRREWRAQHRAWRRQWREKVGAARSWSPVPPFTLAPPMWIGLLMPIFSVITLAFFAGLVLAIVSLVTTGGVYGWALPAAIPLWAGILLLIVLFHILTAPMRAMRLVLRVGTPRRLVRGMGWALRDGRHPAGDLAAHAAHAERREPARFPAASARSVSRAQP